MNDTDDTLWVARSPAKINLGLQVLGKLPNGYHEISTGFCFINWNDRFEVRRASSFSLSMSDDRLPVDHTNLIVKAVHLLKRYVALDDAYSVYVDKMIPFGAGLGGGSSNAATVLRILNKISGLDMQITELQSLVGYLGADIPIFLHGKPGIGSGIGTEISFHDIQPDAWIVTVFPDIHVSTAEAYRHCRSNETPDFTVEHILMNEPLEEWRYLLENDLEPWVIHQHPMIGDIKDQLYELGADYAAMSGSGSAVYGLFPQEFVAVDALNQLAEWKLQVNITPPAHVPDIGVYRSS
ncbi:4-(cytidine 5'-diphospho)-2-C-methyl-D-erythritol kinase [Balneolales bacterium ANBcel1]|nr:4-(cytidine 5'-diphospho)-2-C-methyl-D-erythritol kinase [Balneolales bacterium ANBcel1]